MRVACLWFDKPTNVSKFAELFLRFSPQICIRENQAIFVEIGKCRHLYSEASFLARANVLLKRNQLSARIGIGENITDSLTLTMFQKSRFEDLPLEAIIELADPFCRDLILRKSVSNLIISFQDLGIKNLGQFKKVPVNELISRFGIIGRHCHNRVNFSDFLSWPSWAPEEVISEKKELPYFEFYGELDPILFVLKGQLDSVFARLFSRQKKARKIQVQIKCEKVSTHPNFLRTIDFDFFAPQSSTKGTLKIFRERLTKEFEKRRILSPIESVQTTVLKTNLSSHGQKNIFNSDEEKQEQIHSVHNQLIELLGKDNIFQAVLTEDRRPEKSWTKKFDSPHEPDAVPVDLLNTIPERTTYLFKRPIKIEITAGFIHINKKRYRILNWDMQVEKITGGWFETPVEETRNTYDRNYFHVEIEGRQRIAVFETPNREYFLHGYYG